MQEGHSPDDEIIEKNGLKVFLDKQTMETLNGRELDYYVGEEGEGFIFTGGVSACGTGSSACGAGSSGCSSCGE
jgi:Fe-S cluster assembly iron-binding protein IscA